MRRLVFALVAVVLPVFVTLVAVEAVLRLLDYPPDAFSPWIADEATAFRFAPGISERMVRTEFDVAIETNENGFRDDPLTEKRAGRTLLLGDSFTVGYGVRRGQIFADLVEERLGSEVVNAGVGGWELVHQLHFFRDRGRLLDADRVVYALYLGNDVSRNGEWEERDDNRLVSRTRSFPLRLSHAAKLPMLLRNARYRLRQRQAEAGSEWVPFADYLAICRTPLEEQGRRAYAETERYLTALVREVSAAGLPLSVVLFPFRTVVEADAEARLAASQPDFARNYDLRQPARRVTAMLEHIEDDRSFSKDLRYADATPALLEAAKAGRILYFKADGHFTEAGHEVLSEVLSGLLQRP